MFRVEFIGLPGSGKSYLRKMLVRRLQLVDNKKYVTSEEAFFEVSRRKMDKVYRHAINILPVYFAMKLIHKLINRSLMQFDAQNSFLAKWGMVLEIFL